MAGNKKVDISFIFGLQDVPSACTLRIDSVSKHLMCDALVGFLCVCAFSLHRVH